MNTMKRGAAAVLSLSVLTAGMVALAPAPAAEAAPAKFRSCAALAKAYPGGVAETRKADARTPGVQKVSRALYRANRHLDRDRDRVACERDAGAPAVAPATPAAPVAPATTPVAACLPFPAAGDPYWTTFQMPAGVCYTSAA